MKKFVVVSILLLTMASCARYVGDFTVISPKNYNANEAHTPSGKVMGHHSVMTNFLIFPTNASPNMETAVYRALDKAPGADHLQNVRVQLRTVWIVAFTVQTCIIEGEAYTPVSYKPIPEVAVPVTTPPRSEGVGEK